MGALTTRKLGATVGAEVLGVDPEQLLSDDTLPQACMEALEENGVLVFRQLHIDDDTQVAFSKRLDDVGKAEPAAPPQDLQRDARSDEELHRGLPAGDGLLAHRRRAGRRPEQGDHAQRACDLLLREARPSSPARTPPTTTSPTPRSRSARTSGSCIPSRPRSASSTRTPRRSRWRGGARSPTRNTRSSGSTGRAGAHWSSASRPRTWSAWTFAEGKALLDDLLERSTAPERVYRHEWTVGDLVIWDNTGVMHRVHPYDPTSGREMHRTTMSGDEPIR